MTELAGAYSQIFVMFAIVVVGYVATKLGYITRGGFNSINSFLIHVALPCLIVSSVAALDPGTGGSRVPLFFAMAFGQYLLLIGFTWLLTRLLHAPEDQKPIYLLGSVCTNTGFLCLPILAAVYGQQTVLGASIYVLMCNLFLGTAGLAFLEAGDPTRDHGAGTGLKLHFSPKMLWNAPLVACVIALVLFFTGLRFPGVVESTIDALGSVCIPMAMVVAGSALAQTDMKSVFTDGRLYAFAFIRQLVIPAVFFLVMHLFIDDMLLLWVFTIMFAAPVGVLVPSWAEHYHQDGPFPARFVVVTTLLSFIFIPLLVTLMGVA